MYAGYHSLRSRVRVALEALKTVAPVYKLTRSQERQYLADADRPEEMARLKTIVAGSPSADVGQKAKLQQAEIPLIDRGFVGAHPTCAGDCGHVPRALTKSAKRSRFARSEWDLGRRHRSCLKNVAYLRSLAPAGLSTR